MNNKKSDGIKSAYELAMERLEKEHGKTPTLSSEQKEALAEVERKTKAKIAETDILFARDREKALAQGDPQQLAEIEMVRSQRLARIREEAEKEKDKIRS